MQEEIDPLPPLLRNKQYEAESVFTPESILREARRQKGLNKASVPAICVLDPDGDIVRHLKSADRTQRDVGWACYHTELYRTKQGDLELGIVPCAVGAAFAVLIAEQLFASGCKAANQRHIRGTARRTSPTAVFRLDRQGAAR